MLAAGAAGRDEVWHPLDYLIVEQQHADESPSDEAYGALVLGPGARGTAADDLVAVQGALGGGSAADMDAISVSAFASVALHSA